MKKTIPVEQNANPLRRRLVAQYNAMTEEQQAQWDRIDSLPKEQIRLNPIRRVRNPDIRAGTVFAMHLPDDTYLYGKIVASADSIPHIEPGFFSP